MSARRGVMPRLAWRGPGLLHALLAAASAEHSRPSLAWLGLAWLGVAWRGVAWRGVAWRGVAWRGVASLRRFTRGLVRACLPWHRLVAVVWSLCSRVACNCARWTTFVPCMLHSKLDPAFSIIGAEMAERELAAQRVGR